MLVGCALQGWPAAAQSPVVGFVNVSYPAGDNLIGNPLAPTSNSINFILTAPTIPAGSTFRKWNTTNGAWSVPSVFNGSSWSLDYTLGYAEGGWLYLPSATTIWYMGWLQSNPPRPPTNAGIYLLAAHLYIVGETDSARATNFNTIVGRTALKNEFVQRLDVVSQTGFISICTNANWAFAWWNNGAPSLRFGESAFFNLGPVPPATISGQVQLEQSPGGPRAVTFVSKNETGPGRTALQTSVVSLAFTNSGSGHFSQAAYSLSVPAGTTHLTAKTAWHLRQKQPVSFASSPAVANFQLRIGDVDGSNKVDLGDYSKLATIWYTPGNPAVAAVDLDGNGKADLDDYFILSTNWLLEGDPE